MRAALAVLLLIVCITGCGSEVSSSGERKDLPPVVLEQHRPADIRTEIVGASKAQEELLREILAGIDPDHVEKAIVEPVEAGWEPFPEGAVQITLTGPDSFQADWDRLLVAGAFKDRSQAAGLPLVEVWINVDDGARGGGGGNSGLPGQLPDIERLAKRVGNAADDAGARVRGIRVPRPWDNALAVSFEVDDPAMFLVERFDELSRAVTDIDSRFAEGSLLEVFAAKATGSLAGTRPSVSVARVRTSSPSSPAACSWDWAIQPATSRRPARPASPSGRT